MTGSTSRTSAQPLGAFISMRVLRGKPKNVGSYELKSDEQKSQSINVSLQRCATPNTCACVLVPHQSLAGRCRTPCTVRPHEPPGARGRVGNETIACQRRVK